MTAHILVVDDEALITKQPQLIALNRPATAQVLRSMQKMLLPSRSATTRIWFFWISDYPAWMAWRL